MKKAFTLVELLAVIIILGIVMIIAVPVVSNVINDSKEKSYMEQENRLLKIAYQYSISNNLGYDDGITKKITYEQLMEEGLLTEIPLDPRISEPMGGCITYIWDEKYQKYEFDVVLDCSDIKEEETNPDYVDPNLNGTDPKLVNNLIPVTISPNGDVIVVDASSKWYDYENKEWANAITLKQGQTANVGDVISLNSEGTYDIIAAMYVWIPRFEYQIFDTDFDTMDKDEASTIKVRFVNTDTKNTNTILDNWYTHPAFTFGDDEISGFWFAKFEITGSKTEPTVLPNVKSFTYQSVSSYFDLIADMSIGYNLISDVSSVDTHMMKNMEWAAVAYLTNSIYGKNSEVYINNNSGYITGCGADFTTTISSTTCLNAYGTKVDDIYNQSTTNNISGIFDMSGGAYEYVMGNMVNAEGEFYSSSSGFDIIPESKYYDSYLYGETYNDSIAFERGLYGDATFETTRWYSDTAVFPSLQYSWFVRGGRYTYSSSAGLYFFYRATGGGSGNYSTRPVISIF